MKKYEVQTTVCGKDITVTVEAPNEQVAVMFARRTIASSIKIEGKPEVVGESAPKSVAPSAPEKKEKAEKPIEEKKKKKGFLGIGK
jgi:hypothetical protein